MIALIFNSNNTLFSIEAEYIQEISRMIKMDFFPSDVGVITSVINYRGNTIPIIDSLKYLKKEVGTYNKDSIIIILNINGELLGLLSDDILKTVEIEANMVEKYQISESDYFNQFFRIEQKIYPLLNLNRVAKDIKKDISKTQVKLK